jgi:CheY-like chemotaxis protein
VLDAAARLLRAEGFEVTAAEDAERGVEMLGRVQPDLAVVDLKLPGMSGLEFMEAARAERPRLQVILTTGVSTAEQAVAALNRGAFDFLPKPFTYEELLSPVLRACRHLEITKQGGAPKEAPQHTGVLFLGLQAWARPEGDHSVRLGVTDLFQRTAGSVLEVVPPKIHAEIRQGAPLARVRTEEGRWHVALAAVGGRVVSENADLVSTPQLLNDDPLGSGWVALVQAPDLYRDLPNLSELDH